MNEIILNRKEEIVVLQDMLDSNRAEFLTIYGRRRIGKTFLIREFFSERAVHAPIIFFKSVGLKNGTLAMQLKNFMRQMAETFYQGAQLETPKNWEEAFDRLTQAMKSISLDKKIVLFFDELPWMATKNSQLLQYLDYYWNLHWSNQVNIKLIVCGSSASWIIKKIIKNKGGLHNRTTRQIHLSPFTLRETEIFLKARQIAWNREQIMSLYMITGGVPFYLLNIIPGLSVPEIIEKLAFSKKSLLLGEFDDLFSSLFEQPELHIKILRLIAQCREGIAQEDLLNSLDKSLQGEGGLNKLQALEDADFIIRFKPHFHQKKGIYYKLIDEYTLFYFHWIEPIKDTLQEHSLEKGNWVELQNTPTWYAWCGYSFEAICYKHLFAIRKKLKLSPTAVANSWRFSPHKTSAERGTQIDLLFDRRDDVVTLCEIKYTREPFVISKDYAEKLCQKMTIFKKKTKTKKQLLMALISANGLKNNVTMIRDDVFQNLISSVVTLDDLFV